MRVSLGHSNTTDDCDVLLDFLRDNFLNKAPAVLSAPPLTGASGVSQSMALASLSGSDVDDMCLSTQISVARGLRSDDTTASNQVPAGDDREVETSVSEGIPPAVRLAAIFVYPIKSCAGARCSFDFPVIYHPLFPVYVQFTFSATSASTSSPEIHSRVWQK